MAEKYSFVFGVLSNEFLQLKTTDNIYLKDLLEQEIFPGIAEYNSRTSALKSLFAYDFEDKNANTKKMFASDEFTELSEIEVPANRNQFDSWNRPVPIRRFGAATKLHRETIVQMTSKQITEWANAKFVADQKLIVKEMFSAMATKAPSSRVDALTHIAATPKAFWNNEGSMDTPRPNGQITFDGDHDHYLAVATKDNLNSGAELDTLISRVTEHEGANGQVLLWACTGATINLIKADTAFKPIKEISAILGAVNPEYNNSGFVQALINGTKVMGYNVKAVGTWKEAVVIETPDLPADYILATMYHGENHPSNPLAFRTHPQFPGLMLVSESGNNPIIGADAQYRRYLGLGVNERSMGACLYVGDTSWDEPSFS